MDRRADSRGGPCFSSMVLPMLSFSGDWGWRSSRFGAVSKSICATPGSWAPAGGSMDESEQITRRQIGVLKIPAPPRYRRFVSSSKISYGFFYRIQRMRLCGWLHNGRQSPVAGRPLYFLDDQRCGRGLRRCSSNARRRGDAFGHIFRECPGQLCRLHAHGRIL
jgi:hypothetical protein